MSVLPRLEEGAADEFVARVRREAGGPFDTPLVGYAVACVVCAGPTQDGFASCFRCGQDRASFGTRLADLVVPLTYAVAGRTSGRLMRLYKSSSATPRSRVLLGRLLRTALGLHGSCLEAALGDEIDAWVSVPSTRIEAPQPHPLRHVARTGGLERPSATLKVRDFVGDARDTSENRFEVQGDVAGRTVLVLDDTWVTGGRAQSAAVALRDAGAARAAVVVVSRWLSLDRADTAEFVRRHVRGDYDPTVCPVGMCVPHEHPIRG